MTESEILRIWNGPTSQCNKAKILQFAADLESRLRAESAQEPVRHFHAALTTNPTYGAALWLDRRIVARIVADVANSVITPEDSEPQWHKDAMVFVNAVNAAPVAKPAVQEYVSVPIPDHIRGYNLLYQAAIEFVDKVERGEARSKRSYQSFKEALSLLATSKEKT